MPLRIVPYEQQTSVSLAGMPRASAPAIVDPTGAAVQQLAGQVQKIGADMYQVSREADLHDRLGKAATELSDLELRFDRDSDFRTSPQRFDEQAKAIGDKYMDGVQDQAVATAFRRQYQTLSLAKSINVRKDSWKKEGDYNISALDTNIDTYATQAANARNPGEAAVVEQQARLAIASAQTNGWLSAVDAGKRERTFLQKRDSAVVIRDLSLDPILTASKLSLDPEYAQHIDPVLRERYSDQAWKRAESDRKSADVAAEKERKRLGDENMKEAFSRMDKGVLTRDYVEGIRSTVEPTEYKSLLVSLNGGDRKDDPTAYAEITGLVYSNQALAERRAYTLHQQGKITNATLAATVRDARNISRQEGPKTAYERERLFITNAVKPSDLVPDPAGSARFALAIREYDDFALKGNPTDQDLRNKADAVLKKFSMVNMVDLANKTSAGAQPTPQQQLETVAKEAQQLISDRDTKKITPQEFNRKMDTLNRTRKAAEKAMQTNGGK